MGIIDENELREEKTSLHKKKRNENAIQYVDNKKLYDAMVEYIAAYRKAGKEKPRIPEYIGKCILLIATNLTKHYRFSGYTNAYKDEMISDGYLACVSYLHNFNPDKFENPHAYITKICYYAYFRRINMERKQQYVKLKTVQTMASFEELQESGIITQELYENNYEFIRGYEDGISEKKKRTKLSSIDNFIEE